MKWIQTSIAIERVVVEKATTLFEQYKKNGFTEEKQSNNTVWLTFFAEVEDGDKYLNEEGSIWKKHINELLEENKIKQLEPLKTSVINVSDWLNGYKEFTNEVKILPGLVICPKWKKYHKSENETVYSYDTSLSFGTGEHDTTYSCAQLINLYGKTSQKILDIGTGTGILLLVAHYVNKNAELFGIDIDSNAVEQARINCLTNNIIAKIIEGDLAVKYNDSADLIVANLTVDPLKFLLPIIQNKLTDNGILIISGIIDERLDEIMPYIKDNWQIIEHIKKSNWNTFALKRT